MLPGSGDEDAGGNRSPQVDLSVHLDPGLGLSEVCPPKGREREINSIRVQGIKAWGLWGVDAFFQSLRNERNPSPGLGECLQQVIF